MNAAALKRCIPLAFALLATHAGAQGPEPAPVTIPVQEAVLPNGLKLLVVEDHSAPVVTLQIWVRSGARSSGSTTGVPHLLEHMFFRPGRTAREPGHARVVQAMGGNANAFTAQDFTQFFDDIPAARLDDVLEAESSRLLGSNVQEEALAAERLVVLEEIGLRVENVPSAKASQELFALAFRTHPYRAPTLGWPEDVQAATALQLNDHLRRHFTPDNTFMVVAGDVAMPEVLKRVKRHFGRWRRASGPLPVLAPEAEQRGERRATIKTAAGPTLVAMGFRIPPAAHEDRVVLEALHTLLFQGRGSRFARVASETGPIQSAESGLVAMQQSSLFPITVVVRPGEDPAKAEAALLKELDRVAQEPLQAKELARVKSTMEAAHLRSVRRMSGVATELGICESTRGSWQRLNDRLPAIRALTAADLQRVARNTFVQDHRSVVTVIPGATAARSTTSSTGRGAP